MNYLKREIKTLFFFLIPYRCMGKDKIWKRGDLFYLFKKQIFRNILNLNKYNPDNLEEEDDPPFFWRDIKS